MNRDEARAKIEKLMAFGNDGRGNEHEMEAALRHAEKLMRKHGIEAAELHERTGERPVYQWSTVLVPAGAPQPVKSSPLWFNWLIIGIGRFTDTKVTLRYDRAHGICAAFQGDAADVEYAVWLAKHLRDDCRRQSAVFPGDRGEKESFRKGYASRLNARMKELLAERRKAFAEAPRGTALVLVDTKIALRDEQFGRQTYGRASTYNYRSAHAYGAGSAAGDRANIHRPVGSTSRPALKGS